MPKQDLTDIKEVGKQIQLSKLEEDIAWQAKQVQSLRRSVDQYKLALAELKSLWERTNLFKRINAVSGALSEKTKELKPAEDKLRELFVIGFKEFELKDYECGQVKEFKKLIIVDFSAAVDFCIANRRDIIKIDEKELTAIVEALKPEWGRVEKEPRGQISGKL
jgi:hypothetical protein